MSVTIKINDDQVNIVVLSELQRYYLSSAQDKLRIQAMVNPPEYEVENLRDVKEIMKALKKVIKHYSTQSEYEEWKRKTGL